METAVRPARSVPARPRAPEPERGNARVRIAHLDRLKVILVAVIIAGHGAMSYSDLENAWPYQDVQEVALPEGLNIALGLIVLPAALFAMGLFFLVAGLVTPESLERKGPRRFARDRVVRLGIPFAVWVLAIWPAAVYVAHRAAGRHEGYWRLFTHNDPFLDTGPLWFVEVLLVFSLGYAAWRSSRSRRPWRPRPLAPTLVRLAVGVSLATVVVRFAFPLGSNETLHPNFWQWPQYLALFGLGIAAARRNWLMPVEPAIARACGRAALGGVVAFVLLAAIMAATGVEPDVLFDEHFHWAASALALIEGPLAIGASVWLLSLAQRRLDRPLTPRASALSRSAFAAFLLQGVVLIALAIGLRPIGLPAELKAVIVALAGTAASFGLGFVAVTKTALGRVL